MPIQGDYEPSPYKWVARQVEEYEASGGTRANTLLLREEPGGPFVDSGYPIILFSYLGRKSGKLYKGALMRVENDGSYALIASKGGLPNNPEWYHNLLAKPEITIQDGPEPKDYVVHEIEGTERAEWWQRGVEVYPHYEEYQEKTDRLIPIFLAEPA